MKQHITLSIYLSLFSLFLLACQPSSPSVNWPENTAETKPWTRWWWQGSSVTKAGITAELEAFQKAGIGGLELTPIYGVIGEEEQFIDYLSPKWMDMLEFTLQEAERLGLGIDMATGTGWPFGGPWIGENNASKYLAHTTWQIKEGETLTEPIVYQQKGFVRAVKNPIYQLHEVYKEKGAQLTSSQEEPELLSNIKPLKLEDLIEPVEENKNLQVLALDQVRFNKSLPLQSLVAYSDQGEIVDLFGQVSENGMLDWTAPAGNWQVYGIFQGSHGKMVERAAPGGEGRVIDHFSSEAIRHYLSRFDSAFQGRDITSLRSFFNDSYEVDDARGQANWTPEILLEFQKRKGYDLREYWPALFGEDTEENNQRVLSDYRETIADLLLENFTQEWDTWAESKGAIIRNQSHGSPANILDLYAASDIPETEGADILRIKFATSAAHVSGKKLVSAEAATWLDEHFFANLSDLKENVDRYFLGGVNHVFYHGTCYSPPEAIWPGRLFYAAIHANPRNSLWHDFPAFNQYITQTQSFLQSGKPDNDILLYFPAYDRYATPQRELLDHFDGHGPSLEGTAVEEIAKGLQEDGYSFDFVSDRQIEQLIVKNERLETGGAMYQTIVIPSCNFLPLSTLKKLIALAENGARVVIHQSLPQSVPGLGDLEKRQLAFQQLLEKFSFEVIDGGLKEAKLGKGVVFLGENIDPLLAHVGVNAESMVDLGLNYAKRKYENGQYYFITNWSDKEVDGWARLETNAKSVMIFDPMKGSKGLAKIQNQQKNSTEVYLQIPKGQSVILITSDGELKGTSWNYPEKSDQIIALDGKWEISFISGGPTLPAPIETKTLASWTEMAVAYQYFSGTARYKIDFSKPEGKGWILDLGTVKESAEVILNGTSLGTLIGPTYQVFIDPNLVKETNTLEINVSNLMLNRIIDLDRRNVLWKKFYNVNFPPSKAESRGKNDLFDATTMPLAPSGLLGPVKLIEVLE